MATQTSAVKYSVTMNNAVPMQFSWKGFLLYNKFIHVYIFIHTNNTIVIINSF